jgi:hypothetical protein
VPDFLIGDDPGGVKQALRDAYRSLLDEAFDALLLAHGEPVPSGGKERLRRFVDG